jgi:hypothetical protein
MAMAAVTAVAEEVQQRTERHEHERQHTEHMRAMLGDEEEPGDREKPQ